MPQGRPRRARGFLCVELLRLCSMSTELLCDFNSLRQDSNKIN